MDSFSMGDAFPLKKKDKRSQFTLDLKSLCYAAWVKGFMASAEGYNGEYPFHFDHRSISKAAGDHFDFDNFISEILVEYNGPD